MKKYDVIIIGSGFGGQCAAINLQKNGITNYAILERRDFMGGTWCQNTYPGAAVDVQSPLYSFSFEPYKWSQMFAEQNELKEYTNHIIDKYKLRDKTVLNATVTALKWSDSKKLWEVTVNGEEEYQTQFVINAGGPLSNPLIPNFKGLDTFKGKSFHTNNWDHSYDYKNKRVAVIGSGASAAQVIPTIAPDVKKLSVFQRNPHWVMPRPDRKFSFVERNMLGNEKVYKAVRSAIYWGLETRVIGFKYSEFMLKTVAQREAVNYINKVIKDKDLRKKVTPNYTIGCKRVVLSSDLYPAYTRDNVDLYTKEQAIKEITPTGIITADGKEIDLDLIIYATGYDAVEGNVGYTIHGKNGYDILDFWNEYPRAYLGTTIPKFPNLFLIIGPNTGIGHTSAIFIIESQMNYIIHSIKALKKRNKKVIEVKEEVEEKYTEMIHKEMEKTVWKSGGCSSWYQNKSGKVIAMYPGFSFTFYNLTNNFKPNNHLFS